MTARNADLSIIAALASGKSTYDAAAKAKVSPSTVLRRLQNADFRRQVEQARNSIFEQTCAELAAAGSEAVQTLRKLLKANSEMARLGACRCILECSVSFRELTELASRVSLLEEAVTAGAGGRKAS